MMPLAGGLILYFVVFHFAFYLLCYYILQKINKLRTSVGCQTCSVIIDMLTDKDLRVKKNPETNNASPNAET